MTNDTAKLSAKAKALAMQRIYEERGELTPALVVQESDPRRADGLTPELAPLFDWDDAKAAVKWRHEQARAQIRAVEPILVNLGVLTVEAPYHVHDPTRRPGEAGYLPLLSVKTREEVAADVMEAEVDRAVSALSRAYAVALALELEDQAAAVHAALGALGRVPAPVDAADVVGREVDA